MKKNNVLANIRKALATETPAPTLPDGDVSRVYAAPPTDLITCFQAAFEAIQGRMVYCRDEDELLLALKGLVDAHPDDSMSCRSAALAGLFTDADLRPITERAPADELDATIGITDCECLMARTGTILMSANQSSGRVLPVYVPMHVIIATTDQLVYDIGDALQYREQAIADHAASAWYFVSGPSRTGDIEKTLVLGVHGPVEVVVFLLETLNK